MAMALIQGKTGEWETVIGLEVHAQLAVPTKLFSPAAVPASSLGLPPNTSIHPFDLAVPGMLPVCSKSAVRAAVLTAAAPASSA